MDKTQIQKYLQSEEGQELLGDAIKRYLSNMKEVFVISRVSNQFFRFESKNEKKRQIVINYDAFKTVLRTMGEYSGTETLSLGKRVRQGEILEIALDGLKYSFEPAIDRIHRIYLQELDKTLEHQQILDLFKSKIHPYIDKFINGGGKDEELFQDIIKTMDEIKYNIDNSEMLRRYANKYIAVLKEWNRSMKLFHLNSSEITDETNKKYMVTMYYFYEKVMKLNGEK